MLDFIPKQIKDALSHINLHDIYELRLRADLPITVNYKGKYCYLGAYGIVSSRKNALFCTHDVITDCVFRAGKYSIYSVEEQIKQGFITAKDGERVGLAGEYVLDHGQPLTIRNFTSICIRVPHDIIDCGKEIMQRCMSDKLHSTLICAPPGIGKTTILRDLSRQISKKYAKNILICDERGELSLGWLGDQVDIIQFSSKKIAIESGIRAMRPEIIITDELSEGDCQFLELAVCAGISIIGTAHFDAFENILPCFLESFQRFVILQNDDVGKILQIYDNKGRVIET